MCVTGSQVYGDRKVSTPTTYLYFDSGFESCKVQNKFLELDCAKLILPPTHITLH
jgi:hypothetical protein